MQQRMFTFGQLEGAICLSAGKGNLSKDQLLDKDGNSVATHLC